MWPNPVQPMGSTSKGRNSQATPDHPGKCAGFGQTITNPGIVLGVVGAIRRVFPPEFGLKGFSLSIPADYFERF